MSRIHRLSSRVAVLTAVATAALATSGGGLAAAEETAAARLANAPEEIIVTARKREESIMQTPVVMQAVSQQQIQNMHIEKVQDISSVAPGVEINYGFALAGATVNFRGLGNGGSGNYLDQDVAMNIDGFTSSSGTLYRQGMFDVGQIEVLKGPQSLFFGKSTSGGLISIHSADPTKNWDTKVSVGYEFVADEMDLDGYISGPISDNLGIRIAGYHNTSKGYLYNPDPNNPAHRLPAEQDDGGRVTLKYDNPDTGLRVKLKGSFTKDRMDNIWEGEFNQGGCALSGTKVPVETLYDNCKVDQYTAGYPTGLPYNANGNFAFGSPDFQKYTMDPAFKNGTSYAYTKTALGVLNVDYDLGPGLTVSSVTALDFVKAADAGEDPSTAPITNIPLYGISKTQEFSEELRLASNWKDRWYNFMVGGLYNTARRRDRLVIDYTGVTLFADAQTRYETKTEGAFAQVMLTPIQHWELSAGVRYTHVHKQFDSMIGSGTAQNGNSFFSAFGFGPASLLTYLPPTEYIGTLPTSLTHISENATTPEVTLKYTPTDDFMAFASFKKGYKGPAINTSVSFATFLASNITPVHGEHVTGGEGGIKASLLDRQLALTATGYLYQYSNLQVAFTDVAHSLVTVNNGANARIQGLEVGADYSPLSIRGLTINGFVNYNDSHFTAFPFAPCWGDEPASFGCTTTAAHGTTQDLKGRTLSMAPKWVGSLGGTYKWDVNDKYTAAFNLGGRFSSSYHGNPDLNPQSVQPSYVLLDVGVRFGPEDGAWELSLQCKDCTNRFYIMQGTDPGANSGDTIHGAPSSLFVARPREVTLQLTVHPWRD